MLTFSLRRLAAAAARRRCRRCGYPARSVRSALQLDARPSRPATPAASGVLNASTAHVAGPAPASELQAAAPPPSPSPASAWRRSRRASSARAAVAPWPVGSTTVSSSGSRLSSALTCTACGCPGAPAGRSTRQRDGLEVGHARCSLAHRPEPVVRGSLAQAGSSARQQQRGCQRGRGGWDFTCGLRARAGARDCAARPCAGQRRATHCRGGDERRRPWPEPRAAQPPGPGRLSALGGLVRGLGRLAVSPALGPSAADRLGAPRLRAGARLRSCSRACSRSSRASRRTPPPGRPCC